MKVYEIITDRIMKKLEEGTVPWRKPWNASAGLPKNLVSRKEYRGINVFLTGSQGYESPYWLTFKQAKALGGCVREGEKGTPIVYCDTFKKEVVGKDGELAEKQMSFLRYYTVFNMAQVDGVEAPASSIVERPFNPIKECEKLVADMPHPPELKVGVGGRAFYRSSEDAVYMPRAELFVSDEEYYSTLFHELVHSTGHETRLNRRPSTEHRSFGDEAYSKEELVAEMGASFLSATAGIENATLDNSAAYIQGWLAALRDDKKMVILAAAAAQKASDYILNYVPAVAIAQAA
jgi:antirestriction protein ArdC